MKRFVNYYIQKSVQRRQQEKQASAIERTLMISVGFTLLLLLARIFYTKSSAYLFYPWNLFLAIVPLFFSRRLYRRDRLNFKSIMLICCWLLFFPNAPYLVTDVFHFEQRPVVPYWYDLLLVISGAWNGLILGFVSLLQVEHFLVRHLKPVWAKYWRMLFIIMCAYGVYIGRYLRYNSWDIITDPLDLVKSSARHLLFPQHHLQVWAFTFAFSAMLFIVYYTIRMLQQVYPPQNIQRK